MFTSASERIGKTSWSRPYAASDSDRRDTSVLNRAADIDALRHSTTRSPVASAYSSLNLGKRKLKYLDELPARPYPVSYRSDFTSGATPHLDLDRRASPILKPSPLGRSYDKWSVDSNKNAPVYVPPRESDSRLRIPTLAPDIQVTPPEFSRHLDMTRPLDMGPYSVPRMSPGRYNSDHGRHLSGSNYSSSHDGQTGIYDKIKSYINNLVNEPETALDSDRRDTKRVKFNDYDLRRPTLYRNLEIRADARDALDDTVRRNQQRFDDKTSQLQDERARLKKTVDELNSRLKKVDEEHLIELEAMREQYHAKIRQVDDSYKTHVADLESRILALDETYQSRVANLESQLKLATENQLQQTELVEALQRKETNLLSQLNLIRQEADNLRRERDFRLLELSQREAELLNMKKQVDDGNSELRRREDELRQLQQALDAKDTELRLKQAKVDELQDEYTLRLDEVTQHEIELQSKTAENKLRDALSSIKERYENERLLLSNEFVRLKGLIERNAEDYERFCIKSRLSPEPLPILFGRSKEKIHAQVAQEISAEMALLNRIGCLQSIRDALNETNLDARKKRFLNLQEYLINSQRQAEQKLDLLNSKIFFVGSPSADDRAFCRLYSKRHRILHGLRLSNDVLTKLVKLFEMIEDFRAIIRIEEQGLDCNGAYHKVKLLLNSLVV